MGKNKNKSLKRMKQIGGATGIGSEGVTASMECRTAKTTSGDRGAESTFSSLTDTTVSLSNSSTPKHEKDHLAEWNPMAGVSESLLNTVSDKDTMSTIGKLLTGVSDSDRKDILCPFNDDKGGCFKVSCPYKHVQYSIKVLKKLPKLRVVCESKSESTRSVDLLPVQVLPANDCISKVAIPTAFHPGHFYVVPEKGWECQCKSQATTTEEHSKVNGFDDLEFLLTALQNRFKTRPFTNQHSEYVAGELVIVRMFSDDSTKTFYRGKVLKDSVPISDNEDDIFKPVDVELQLLDYGLRIIKSSKDITCLPAEFCHISPLAYKCELFGVSPIMGSWSSLAMERFKHLVSGHYVIAEVVRTGSSPVYSLGDNSCLVNLYIKSRNGDFIDVAQDLIEAGLGIAWNMYTKRPRLNEILEGRQNRFALSLS
ncbi:Tudor domain-containing protein 15 [Orchesella cincta]|uniref:Tudor domain-containing protein 15 n=1 Tax=Orchesella cincta TaxID=48709 RepID=A0A1D2NII3_ORCCI|nr:Tudor domain-containing protein 15 [Orchesella cincta]